MDDQIINEGVELMVVGMGVVFAFLILLVVFMSLSGAFFQKFSHWFAEPPQPDAPRGGGTADGAAKVAVAVAAAHRARNGH